MQDPTKPKPKMEAPRTLSGIAAAFLQKAREHPRAVEAAKIGAGFVPVLGDALGLVDAARDVKAGRYGSAAMNAGLAAVPFVSGSTVKAVAEAAPAVKRAVTAADDLPMDTPSRMARARDMGFSDEEFYKGLYPLDWTKEANGVPGPEIETLQRNSPFPAFGGSDGDIPAGKIAAFMSKDPEVANRFGAAFRGGAVMPLRLRQGRVAEIDAAGRKAGEIQFGPGGREFRDTVRSGEYDTVLIRNTADEGDVYVVLKPENIRSKFAKFDPSKADSPNLSAAVAGTAIGAALLADQQRKRQPQTGSLNVPYTYGGS